MSELSRSHQGTVGWELFRLVADFRVDEVLAFRMQKLTYLVQELHP